jgi:chemotaxis protein methyltransferase CheR
MDALVSDGLTDATFGRIKKLMYDNIGIDFDKSKRPLITSRLTARIGKLGLHDFEEYVDLVCRADNGGEFQMMVDLLTTNETYFFREPKHFDLLEKELIRRHPTELKIWSAASSFGDEAYSLAMLLADLQMTGKISPEWSILGTDISDRVLRSATEAIYPVDRLRHVTPTRLKRYCLRGEGPSEGLVAISPKLTARVSFGQLNLCQSVDSVGKFDVVFLRNVLIYFDAKTKSEVVSRVVDQIKPGGLLFIGTAEGRVPCRTPLTPLIPGAFMKGGVSTT